MDNSSQKLVKGGCGHSDCEVEFSAVVSGICFGLILLVLIVACVAKVVS